MAAIKSYTDIEQSRKLAKILPLESADMHSEAVDDEGDMVFIIVGGLGDKTKSNYGSPVWSLAALLGVLPKNLNIGRPSLESNYKRYYWIQYYDEFMKPNNYKTECFNNPVDACVEMIELLHELKML